MSFRLRPLYPPFDRFGRRVCFSASQDAVEQKGIYCSRRELTSVQRSGSNVWNLKTRFCGIWDVFRTNRGGIGDTTFGVAAREKMIEGTSSPGGHCEQYSLRGVVLRGYTDVSEEHITSVSTIGVSTKKKVLNSINEISNRDRILTLSGYKNVCTYPTL
jgi:hypothetical protein